MPDGPPVLQSKTEKLVQSSFTLGMASIACGITALPAIIQSTRALVYLRRETENKKAFRKVIFSLVFSSCILAFAIFNVVSMFWAAHGMANQMNCVENMKTLGLAVRIYVGDNRDVYPPANWCDAILTNGIGSPDYLTNISKSFYCPAAPKKQKCSYAMNRQLVGIKDTDQIASNTVMLFESDAGWNAVGGQEIAALRHYKGFQVVLVDGSVQEVYSEKMGDLRWNPYTNNPAK